MTSHCAPRYQGTYGMEHMSASQGRGSRRLESVSGGELDHNTTSSPAKAISPSFPSLPVGSPASQLDRVWRVDFTGVIGTAACAMFPLSSGPYSTLILSARHLRAFWMSGSRRSTSQSESRLNDTSSAVAEPSDSRDLVLSSSTFPEGDMCPMFGFKLVDAPGLRHAFLERVSIDSHIESYAKLSYSVAYLEPRGLDQETTTVRDDMNTRK
ncbi:hypothetical protein EDD18DRAFT_1335707 [Armillaria luteobubalina]|uniref:Uncharacterized protein n=1 Tax=Armillaria luteobubalina TaxID=153913 RepID=A0AA39PLQ3_9AGAR|nr:hypothetical protein EDD18DRAFT_1335707 [Armillaria luteobubalina]